MTTIVGIDPGVTGAIAFIIGTGIRVYDMPPNPADLADLLREQCGMSKDVRAIVEKAQAMPKQGVASMFNYGVGYGTILGTLATLGVPYELVTPAVWKRALGLVGKPKDASRALARQLYPSAPLARVKDHGRAEALLLAHWGQR